MSRIHPSFTKAILSIFLIALLGSCSSSPTLVTDDPQDVQVEVAEQVRLILSRASNSQSPERDKLYLQAAALLTITDELDWARNLLGSIDPDLLFVEDFVQYTLLYSQVAISTDAYFLAQRILTNPRVEQQWPSYSDEDAILLRARRAELFSLLGEANKSVYERVRLNEFQLEPDRIFTNQDAIWESLMAINEIELEQLSLTEPNSVLKGWYSLASLSKNNDSDLNKQQTSIEQWMREWPSHPASLFLPSDLQLLKQLVENQPNSVALLLPLNHDNGAYQQFARFIRDGFMGGYFQAKQLGSRVPQVRIFDTSQADIHSVYDAAVADGAEFIIGPLTPNNVSELSYRIDLSVPTLALNEIESDYGFPENFYQFSLSREGEAIQVANRAWLEGYRRAMILVPKDTVNNSIGSRSADAFTYAFEALGGQVVQRTYFDQAIDYSNDIKEGLLLKESELRHRGISRLVGRSIEFDPRRRRDIDFVFLVARSTEAQGIKPTLKSNYAGDVPVFATSRIYAGTGDTKNRDLNGIKFNTLPWLFSESQEKIAFEQNTRNPNQEFYAMGLDSYRLYPRLAQLQQRLGSKFYGQTGALSLTGDRKIQREQVWAHIVNGTAEALPMVVSEADVE